MAKKNENSCPCQKKYPVPGLGISTNAIQNTGAPTGIPPVRVPKAVATLEYSNRGFDFIHESETEGQ